MWTHFNEKPRSRGKSLIKVSDSAAPWWLKNSKYRWIFWSRKYARNCSKEYWDEKRANNGFCSRWRRKLLDENKFSVFPPIVMGIAPVHGDDRNTKGKMLELLFSIQPKTSRAALQAAIHTCISMKLKYHPGQLVHTDTRRYNKYSRSPAAPSYTYRVIFAFSKYSGEGGSHTQLISTLLRDK